jgi:hypothetical protein
MEVTELSDEDLKQLAAHWRGEALPGVREARGPAHQLEVEMRRRMGANVSVRNLGSLDLRPLSSWGSERRWCLSR